MKLIRRQQTNRTEIRGKLLTNWNLRQACTGSTNPSTASATSFKPLPSGCCWNSSNRGGWEKSICPSSKKRLVCAAYQEFMRSSPAKRLMTVILLPLSQRLCFHQLLFSVWWYRILLHSSDGILVSRSVLCLTETSPLKSGPKAPEGLTEFAKSEIKHYDFYVRIESTGDEDEGCPSSPGETISCPRVCLVLETESLRARSSCLWCGVFIHKVD